MDKQVKIKTDSNELLYDHIELSFCANNDS